MERDFIKNLERIKQGTAAGRIPWEKNSPSVYIWSTKNSLGRKINVILQGIGDTEKPRFLFRVFDVDVRRTIFEIYSDKLDAETATKLKDLYEFIESYLDDAGSNILNDILKDI